MSYEIKENEDGVAVFGPIPAGDMVALADAWRARGFVVMDPGLASAVGATLVVGSVAGLQRWRQRVEVANANHSPELRWLLGADTGISSLTIFAVLTSDKTLRQTARRRRGSPSVPLDSADFGRCFRLLEDVPGWRERLGEVALAHPEWLPLVQSWGELEELHRNRRAGAVTALLRKLNGGGA